MDIWHPEHLRIFHHHRMLGVLRYPTSDNYCFEIDLEVFTDLLFQSLSNLQVNLSNIIGVVAYGSATKGKLFPNDADFLVILDKDPSLTTTDEPVFGYWPIAHPFHIGILSQQQVQYTLKSGEQFCQRAIRAAIKYGIPIISDGRLESVISELCQEFGIVHQCHRQLHKEIKNNLTNLVIE